MNEANKIMEKVSLPDMMRSREIHKRMLAQKSRWKPTESELAFLNQCFRENMYPSKERKEKLLQIMHTQYKTKIGFNQLARWFQHQRERSGKLETKEITYKKFSKEELEFLQESFSKNMYPKMVTMIEIAQKLNSNVSKIENWYKHNRRSLAKKGLFKLKNKKYFMKDELQHLQSCFSLYPRPKKEKYMEIAAALNCDEIHIRNWFSNRRKKQKQLGNQILLNSKISDENPKSTNSNDSSSMPTMNSYDPQNPLLQNMQMGYHKPNGIFNQHISTMTQNGLKFAAANANNGLNLNPNYQHFSNSKEPTTSQPYGVYNTFSSNNTNINTSATAIPILINPQIQYMPINYFFPPQLYPYQQHPQMQFLIPKTHLSAPPDKEYRNLYDSEQAIQERNRLNNLLSSKSGVKGSEVSTCDANDSLINNSGADQTKKEYDEDTQEEKFKYIHKMEDGEVPNKSKTILTKQLCKNSPFLDDTKREGNLLDEDNAELSKASVKKQKSDSMNHLGPSSRDSHYMIANSLSSNILNHSNNLFNGSTNPQQLLLNNSSFGNPSSHVDHNVMYSGSNLQYLPQFQNNLFNPVFYLPSRQNSIPAANIAQAFNSFSDLQKIEQNHMDLEVSQHRLNNSKSISQQKSLKEE